ncbi:hypothetical protein GR248_24270 [Rhizobium leguminosarum]|uniref:hypothetical protein n=1 Tax=Rhizobium leguminosarum TaxID=384 RepID=UPI0013CA5FC2|nr:hypothetical protein [Rhizobium leguminosarum]NEI93918.1 hypothetical protein [Rhizobium leguminosarum]
MKSYEIREQFDSFLLQKRTLDTDELLAEHHEHWAVAWGTSTSLAQNLLSQSAKIRAMTFGLAFAQTDPTSSTLS